MGKEVFIFLLWSSFMFLASGNGDDDWIDPLDPLSHDPTKVERDYGKYIQKTKEDEKKKIINQPQDDDHWPAGGESSSEKETDLKQTLPMKGKEYDSPLEHNVPCPGSCRKEKKKIDDLEKILNKRPIDHMPYFTQFVARFVRLVDKAHRGTFSEPNHFQLDVEINDGEIEILRKFAHQQQGDLVREAHSVLENMIKHLKQISILDEEQMDWTEWITPVAWVVTALGTAGIAVNLQWRVGIPWSRVVGSILVLLFLVSVPWTWWHLYQKELVNRMSKSQMEPPAECRPQDMTWWQTVSSYVSLGDKCEKYYHDLHINPMLDVPPTKAIAVTLTKFVVEPLEHLGHAIGKMVVACLQEVPVQLWPVALAVLIIIFLMLLVMGFGYKINVLYLFGLEPSRPAITLSDQKAQSQIESLNQQILMLTDLQKSQDDRLREHMRTVEEQLGQPQLLALPSVHSEELSSPASMPVPGAFVGTQQSQLYPEQGDSVYPHSQRPHSIHTDATLPSVSIQAHQPSTRVQEVSGTVKNADSQKLTKRSSKIRRKKETSRPALPTGWSSSDIQVDDQEPAGDPQQPITSTDPSPTETGSQESDVICLSSSGGGSSPLDTSSRSGTQSSFDSLVMTSITDKIQGQLLTSDVIIEDVGLSDKKLVTPTIGESSDDSDLEIIEEEPNVSHA